MLESILDEMSVGFRAVSPTLAATRLGVAVLLAGLIGFERERKTKPAGLRTHILVSVAACLFVLTGQELAHLDFGDGDSMQIDPLRLIEATTAGVAFLAAGLIFTSRGKVHNVTTGTSLWMAGAIGVACGAGQMPLALLATIITLTVLLVLGWVERRPEQ